MEEVWIAAYFDKQMIVPCNEKGNMLIFDTPTSAQKFWKNEGSKYCDHPGEAILECVPESDPDHVQINAMSLGTWRLVSAR